MEALACDVPVISTDCPYGPGEILERGRYGILVPINDPQKMAQAILRVAAGEGIVASSDSWKKYTLDAIVDRYEKVLGLK